MITSLEDLMRLLYVLALLCIIFGFVNGMLGLKSMRSKSHPQADVTWKQSPLSPWRYETLTMATITIHSVGLISLAALLALSVVRTGFQALMLQISGWGLFLAVFGIIFTFYTTGVLLSFQLAQPWIKPVSYGISEEGVWYGGLRYGWQSFHHYEAGPEPGLISLSSSYSPTVVSWVLKPPSESLPGVSDILRQHLASTGSVTELLAWQHAPMTFLVAMISLVLVALLPAVWGWLNNQAWVWLYCFIAFLIVLVLGNKLITLFGGQVSASAEQLDNKDHDK